MTNDEAIAHVIAWIEATVPDVAGKSYDYLPAGKEKGLPDVVVELTAEGVSPNDPDFALGGLQQVEFYVWSLACAVTVPMAVDEAGERAAQAELRAIAETLKLGLFADPTVGTLGEAGGPLFAAPRSFSVDYTGPLSEWEDGTRGRSVDFTLKVGEPIVVGE